MPANFLIPRGKLDKILPSCTSRRDSETLLRSFAAELGIAPGIVVGYLQKLGCCPRTGATTSSATSSGRPRAPKPIRRSTDLGRSYVVTSMTSKASTLGSHA